MKHKIKLSIPYIIFAIIFLSTIPGICYYFISGDYKLKNTNISLIESIKDLESRIEENKAKNKENKEKDHQALLGSISNMNPNLDPGVKEQILTAVISECEKYNFPPLLILCIIKEESNFNPLCTSSFNAAGLMQIIPKWHKDKIEKYNWKLNELYYIKNNIALGIEVLEEYFNASNNIITALQKYVGATTKENGKNYTERIISNYISLNMMFFINKKSAIEFDLLAKDPEPKEPETKKHESRKNR